MAHDRSIAALALLAMLSASPCAAWSPPKRAADEKPRTCPEIGQGFVRLPGSEVCVRLGGLVRVEGMAKAGTR